MSFDNKVVLITGAGSGIGEAIAIHFARLSARLSLLDIKAENLQKVVEACDNLSKHKAIKIVIDVTNDDEVKEAVNKTVENFGGIDVLINCAGTINVIGILDHDFISCFDKVIKLNLRSYAVVTHYAAEALVERKGCIINISSIAAKTVNKNIMPYAVSKAAINHFTKNAALELADKGVRVNSISPGSTQTNLFTHSGFSEEKFEEYKRNKKEAPLKRIIQVEEIAELTAYLASDKAKSVTGADFVIDTGYTLLGTVFKNSDA